jgi:hypothetical protein
MRDDVACACDDMEGLIVAKNPLFSTYRQGENRVTSSMLAVFERIDLSLLETILQRASGESSLQTVSFTNQPPGKGHSVPDGLISGRFAYWFEIKTTRNALAAKQLGEHLLSLDKDGAQERLFVITPDPQEPHVITTAADPRIVWFNFRSLHDAIESVTADRAVIIAEQARFLLRELQALLLDEGLLDNDDVVIVAAKIAYGEYLQHSAYICQPGRAFRTGLTHMGFYANAAIQVHLPRIRHREDQVTFTSQEVISRKVGGQTDQLIGKVIEGTLATGTREAGQQYQVFLLSGPGDAETVKLAQPITNNAVSASGKPWAWTLGQRYTSLAKLTASGVGVTSDLGELNMSS